MKYGIDELNARFVEYGCCVCRTHFRHALNIQIGDALVYGIQMACFQFIHQRHFNLLSVQGALYGIPTCYSDINLNCNKQQQERVTTATGENVC
jgi:hypothetical protein